MKLDVAKPITDFDGTELKAPPKTSGGEMTTFTMRDAITGALLAQVPGDDKSPDEGFKRFMLAMRVHDAKGEVELSIDEAKIIKDRAGKCYPALTMGRIWQALEKTA